MNQVVDEVIEFQKGNAQAFDYIYLTVYNRVFYNVKRYVNDNEVCLDITQNVFLTVHQSLDTLKAPEAFFTWIDTITRNLTFREMQTRKNDTLFFYEDDVLESMSVDDSSDPMVSAKYLEVTKSVLESVQKLTAVNQEVAKMRFYDELSINEISEQLEISENTVKSRIHRIRKILIEDLGSKDISVQSLYSVSGVLIIPYAFKMWEAQMAAGMLKDGISAKGALPGFKETLGQGVKSPSKGPQETKAPKPKLTYLGVAIAASVGAVHLLTPSITIDDVSVTALDNNNVSLEVNLKKDNPSVKGIITNTDTLEESIMDYDDGKYAVEIDQNGSYTITMYDGKTRTQKDIKITDINSLNSVVDSIEVSDNIVRVKISTRSADIDVNASYITIGESQYKGTYESDLQILEILLDQTIKEEVELTVVDVYQNKTQGIIKIDQ